MWGSLWHWTATGPDNRDPCQGYGSEPFWGMDFEPISGRASVPAFDPVSDLVSDPVSDLWGRASRPASDPVSDLVSPQLRLRIRFRVGLGAQLRIQFPNYREK